MPFWRRKREEPRPVEVAPPEQLGRIGLVGCVKEKGTRPAAAKDVYTSPLFRGRRRYVERTCDRWWVLSAEHGLVSPEAMLAPYDRTLKTASRDERRRWTSSVLEALDREVGTLSGVSVEIHAGSEYRDFGLVDGLRRRGATVEVPTSGMPIGRQLQFYKQQGGTR